MLKFCISLFVVLVVAVACTPKFESQPDCNFVQNAFGERVSWKKNIPVTMMVHQSVPEEYHEAIRSSLRVWNNSMSRTVFVWGGLIRGPLKPRQDGLSVIYWMDTWESNLGNEQGRTSIYWVGDEVKEADIRVNAKDFKYFWDKPTDPKQVNVESLMIHELGHVLGLKHNDGESSVMATYLASGTTRNDVSMPDISSMSCEY